MNKTMKAVVTVGPKTSEIREVPMPQMDDDSVLIKIKYCGVCHSEHYDWANSPNGGSFGHEPMGIIAEVGKNVTGFQVGDRVSGLWGSTLARRRGYGRIHGGKCPQKHPGQVAR